MSSTQLYFITTNSRLPFSTQLYFITRPVLPILRLNIGLSVLNFIFILQLVA